MTRDEVIAAVAAGKRLAGADLRGAYLHGADLRGAYLHGAYLHGADLHGADLSDANLHGAYLRDADLRGADLRDADLRGADLRGAKTDDKTRWARFQIPQTGTLTVYKKASGKVLTLLIPARAKRTGSLVGRKCRAEYVKVLAGAPTPIKGNYDKKTVYQDGKITRADKWDDDPKVECTHGIHFFLTEAEAREY